MKKIIFTVLILASVLIQAKAQSAFTSVPVVNGKVVFQQFIHIEQELSLDQRYALLYKWGKDNYAGNPLLSGIRFDDKAKSITVSSKIELLLPQNSNGVREKVVMNYRFDATITNAGCMLVIRDINYQNAQSGNANFFPKTFTAEETITSTAISAVSGLDKEFRTNTQKSTLFYFNELYNDLSKIFSLGK
ncbi:DUF4468 domain-containing protein [Petrimonas sp.]|uniref:DUF4468 domain-containing protein n=1 Tax=Petrimonas sp. TaxID=2023866 RepID=UPI003F50F98C